MRVGKRTDRIEELRRRQAVEETAVEKAREAHAAALLNVNRLRRARQRQIDIANGMPVAPTPGQELVTSLRRILG